MNLLSRLVISSTLLLAFSQPSLAVLAGGQSAPVPLSRSPTSTIERGGTIHAVDLAKKTMVVDGVSYAFSATPVKIHGLPEKKQAKEVELKAGMQIRFNSSKNNWSAQDQVVEIWVTSAGDDLHRK